MQIPAIRYSDRGSGVKFPCFVERVICSDNAAGMMLSHLDVVHLR